MYWHKIIQKNKIPSDLGELHFQSVSSKLPLKSVGESIILRTIHNRTNATEIAQILSYCCILGLSDCIMWPSGKPM